MNKDGKLTDVIIEDFMRTDERTGVRFMDGFTVWADKGMREIIANIPGVHIVIGTDTRYWVTLDLRYDVEFLRAEIEAQILINMKGEE